MLVDYLFYDSMNAMASEVMSPTGLVMDYADLITNKVVLQQRGGTALGGGEYVSQKNTRQIGMTGRVLRYLLIAIENSKNNPNTTESGTPADVRGEEGQISKYNPLLGKYTSELGTTINDGESLQIKINNIPILQSPAVADGYKYGLLEEVFGMPLMVPSSQFSHYGQVYDKEAAYRSETTGSELGTKWWCNLGFSRDKLWGVPQTALAGKCHYLGLNLHKPIYTQDGRLQRANVPGSGVMISETPIVIDYNRTITGPNGYAEQETANINAETDWGTNYQRQMYIFACVEKRVVLKNGKFSTSET